MNVMDDSTTPMGTVRILGRSGGMVDVTAICGPNAAGMLADLYTGGAGDPDGTMFPVQVEVAANESVAETIVAQTGADGAAVLRALEWVDNLPGGPGTVEFIPPS